MNGKTVLWLLVMFAAGWALAQAREPMAEVRVRVADQAGRPVPQARVTLSTFNAWVPDRHTIGRDEADTVIGRTDTNGTVTLRLAGSTGRYGCMVLPVSGFRWHRGIEYRFTNAVDGRWEPWSPEISVLLIAAERGVWEGGATNGSPAGGAREPVRSKEPAPGLPGGYPRDLY